MSLSEYHVECHELDNLESLEKIWLDLQGRADCSFFQTWGWFEVWLSQVVGELSPLIISVYFDNRVVGIGILISAKVKRHHVFHSRSIYLNDAPFLDNNLVIEYNGLLAARGHESEVYSHAFHYMLQKFPAIDEFHFSGLTSISSVNAAVNKYREDVKVICQETSTSYMVTLDYPGSGVDAYLSSIGKNRRLQIRRSLRLYAEQGPVLVEEAKTVEQALLYLDGLKVLHTRRWQSLGKAGSFANERWDKFQRTLISSRFEYGEIQLVKVSNSNQEIGYLYNFIWRKRVYVLQTGFALEQDKKLMPGYVVHALAIDYNRDKGMKSYDLLHGDSLYKKLLCNKQQELFWLVVQRKRIRFLLEDIARILIQKLRGIYS